MKMNACVLFEQGLSRPYAQSRPLRMETVELDKPGPGEVLVEIRGAGLCHSDLSTLEGLRPRKLPTVLGHEAAGIVREVGPGVSGLEPDDHIGMSFVGSCGTCGSCARGRPYLCDTSWDARATGALQTGGMRLSLNGKPLYHYSGISCFAEYAVVSVNSVVKIDRAIPLEDAALFGCAVMTGVGAVINTAKLEPGASAAVVGLGGVGLSALLGARAAGANPLIAVDTNPEKLALAATLGAERTYDAREPNCVERILDETGGGVDYAFEMAGAVKAMELAYKIGNRGGVTVTAGLPDVTHEFSFAQAGLVWGGRTIMGSYMGGCSPRHDIPRLLSMYQAGKLPIDKLRSGTIGLDAVNDGFDQLAAGAAVRQVMVPGTA